MARIETSHPASKRNAFTRHHYSEVARRLIASGLVCGLPLGWVACSTAGEPRESIGTLNAAVIGVDTFLYFRCNATGWGVDSNTRLTEGSAPGLFTLSYQVREPWMVTGFDTCTFVETNQLDAWGTQQIFYDKSGSQLLEVPAEGAGLGQLVVSPPGNDYHFQIRYPATGAYRATVHVGARSFRIEPGRPSTVDNSTSIHFPPVGGQELGDCTCWSSGYYYSTYTQARDEILNAASGDESVICSPWFLFSLIAEGHFGAECTAHVMEQLPDVGCAPISLRPISGDFVSWPSEEAWVAGLRSRTRELQRIRADTEEGLETVRQHLARGGLAVTRAVLHENYENYPDDFPGTNNEVIYAAEGFRSFRHSLAIVGYDDQRPYVDHRDGQVHRGAFLLVNSYGPDWGTFNSTGTGTRGFFWVAYEAFKNRQFGFYHGSGGLSDEEFGTDPCYDNPPNPEIYFHEDRPRYRPRLYAVAEVAYGERNHLTFTGGVGAPQTPLFRGPSVIEPTEQGPEPLDGPLVVDLTDGVGLIPTCGSRSVFVSLGVSSSAPASLVATIRRVTVHHDLDGDESFAAISATNVPITVQRGGTRFVSVSVPGLCP